MTKVNDASDMHARGGRISIGRAKFPSPHPTCLFIRQHSEKKEKENLESKCKVDADKMHSRKKSRLSINW